MMLALILEPCDLRNLPPEEYISGTNLSRGEQAPLGVDLKDDR